MSARIYKPSKTAMQSGRGNTKRWVLEFEPQERKVIDPLMGWTGSGDMKGQVRLRFETREDAIAYAEREGIAYTLRDATERTPRPKSYSSNFAFTRRGQWTH